MAVRIIDNANGAVLYCSTDMEAFGPVFENVEAAEDFLEWLTPDARTLTSTQLAQAYDEWHGFACDRDGNFVGRATTTTA